MRIIQVVGRSGSGKTGFIEALVPRLSLLGRVACVKHLGEHTFEPEEGKDTTRYLEAGARISCGIDGKRAVLMAEEAGLPQVLDILADAGMDFAILEGWKGRPYRKIIVGDLDAENCILRNPTVDEVIEHLSTFDEHTTAGGLVKHLLRGKGGERTGAILTFSGRVRLLTGEERTEFLEVPDGMSERLGEVKEVLGRIPGIVGVETGYRTGRLGAGEEITRIAILAEHRSEGARALGEALRILSEGAGMDAGRGPEA